MDHRNALSLSAALLFAALQGHAATLTLQSADLDDSAVGYEFKSEDTDPLPGLAQNSACEAGACLPSVFQGLSFSADFAFDALKLDVGSGLNRSAATNWREATFAVNPASSIRSVISVTADAGYPNLFHFETVSVSIAPISLPASVSLMLGSVFLLNVATRRL